MRDKFVTSCQYCGCTEMVEVYQAGYGTATVVNHPLHGAHIYHAVCKNCGTIVRSYVKKVEKIAKFAESDR